MSSGPGVQKPTGAGPVQTGGSDTVLTLAGVLSSYTSTPNPQMAALEQLISERNVLSSQNSQLWKLVEKQRSGYSQILKELERVRSERDTFKARLTSLGENPDQILKKQKTSKGGNSGNSLKSSSSHSGLRSDGQPKTPTPEDPRQAMTRHQSEDSVPRTRITPSPNDPAHPTVAVRSDSFGSSSTPPILHLNTQPNNGTHTSSSASALSPASSSVSPALTSAQSYTTVISSLPTPTPPHSTLNIPHPSSGDLLQSNHPANLLSSQNADPLRPPGLSRESRISLPEEAKRYIATIGESPGHSPLVSSFKSKSADVRSESPSQASMSETRDDHTQADSVEGDFLDVDESVNDGATGSESSLSDGEFEEDKPSSRSVEDFPMPPTSHPPVAPSAYSPSNAPDQTSIHSGHTSSATSATIDPAASTTSFQSSNLPHISQPKPHHKQKRSIDTTVSVQPQFRQLPLLVSDFPMTRVQVSHSSIRPNDRGKEVLSFVIVVDPGSGKEPWKIEKLYSDFISLDQKTRSGNRNLSKKMPSLPDSRLWRDHAPAKVDQRKVALEKYLQAVLLLPVKDRNEVAAFFTSDIVRARQPVASAGYKEGYLTKRGKNFGGWKRRYFVLQGSVLEYYESRGGAHLGSITITGAQIGRQQRAGTSQGVDEDNEYRHAFLIIEAKKNQSNSSNSRHVLCAESDGERDSWVEILVRHVNGGYYDEQQNLPSSSSSTYSNGLSPIVTSVTLANSLDSAQPRSSTSSVGYSEQTLVPNKQRGFSRDDAGRPIHGTLQEEGNSPLEAPTSTSLPSSSPLDGDGHTFSAPRSQSSLGHDDSSPDIKGTPSRPHPPTNHSTSSPEYHRAKERDKRRSVQPIKVSSNIPKPSIDGRSSPDIYTPRVDQNGKVKISGPYGGAPIPPGYKFGASGKEKEKETTEQLTPGSDRREKSKSKMFWTFGKPNEKNPAPVQPQPSRTVFGTTLEESLEVAQIANLPAVVFRCIQYLESKKADQEEGIYRLSGSSAVIKSLKDRFNLEGDVDLLASDEYWDPHAIAGLLKTFMRELPASILTRELHTRFLSVIDFVDAQERIKELSSLISQLPLANYSLLRALTAHLILIVQNSNVNKMTMRNVGIVFSPTLGIPAGVFSLMLGEFNRVFNVEELGSNEEDPEDSPARRNSRHYSDAAADKLLGLVGRTLKVPPSEDSEGEDDPPGQEDNGSDSGEGSRDAETSPATNLNNSRASNIAASRGLNVNVGATKSSPKLLRPGLPVSPRPPNSPRYSPSPNASPMTTPR